MNTEIVRFDASRRADFFKLHSAVNDHNWCFCAAWWVKTWEGWGQRTAEENRALRETLCDRGEYDGYLLYFDEKPIGWCQVGPRDRLGKLTEQFQLDPSPNTWAITCFLIAPAYRGQGWASHLLNEVLKDLLARGVKRVEAFPKRGVTEVAELWNGPESMFLRAGFLPSKDDQKRPILALEWE
jgi:GNAT superfamily N-acetyltransferase